MYQPRPSALGDRMMVPPVGRPWRSQEVMTVSPSAGRQRRDGDRHGEGRRVRSHGGSPDAPRIGLDGSQAGVVCGQRRAVRGATRARGLRAGTRQQEHRLGFQGVAVRVVVGDAGSPSLESRECCVEERIGGRCGDGTRRVGREQRLVLVAAVIRRAEEEVRLLMEDRHRLRIVVGSQGVVVLRRCPGVGGILGIGIEPLEQRTGLCLLGVRRFTPVRRVEDDVLDQGVRCGIRRGPEQEVNGTPCDVDEGRGGAIQLLPVIVDLVRDGIGTDAIALEVLGPGAADAGPLVERRTVEEVDKDAALRLAECPGCGLGDVGGDRSALGVPCQREDAELGQCRRTAEAQDQGDEHADHQDVMSLGIDIRDRVVVGVSITVGRDPDACEAREGILADEPARVRVHLPGAAGHTGR